MNAAWKAVRNRATVTYTYCTVLYTKIYLKIKIDMEKKNKLAQITSVVEIKIAMASIFREMHANENLTIY